MAASKRIQLTDAERDFAAVLDTAEAGVNVMIERRGIPFTLQRVWPKTVKAAPARAAEPAPPPRRVAGNGAVGAEDVSSTFSVPTNLGGQPGAKGLRFQLRLRNRQQ